MGERNRVIYCVASSQRQIVSAFMAVLRESWDPQRAHVDIGASMPCVPPKDRAEVSDNSVLSVVDPEATIFEHDPHSGRYHRDLFPLAFRLLLRVNKYRHFLFLSVTYLLQEELRRPRTIGISKKRY
jgi:hypothetical protein